MGHHPRTTRAPPDTPMTAHAAAPQRSCTPGMLAAVRYPRSRGSVPVSTAPEREHSVSSGCEIHPPVSEQRRRCEMPTQHARQSHHHEGLWSSHCRWARPSFFDAVALLRCCTQRCCSGHHQVDVMFNPKKRWRFCRLYRATETLSAPTSPALAQMNLTFPTR